MLRQAQHPIETLETLNSSAGLGTINKAYPNNKVKKNKLSFVEKYN